MHEAAAFNSPATMTTTAAAAATPNTDKMYPNSFVLSARDDGCVLSTGVGVCSRVVRGGAFEPLHTPPSAPFTRTQSNFSTAKVAAIESAPGELLPSSVVSLGNLVLFKDRFIRLIRFTLFVFVLFWICQKRACPYICHFWLPANGSLSLKRIYGICWEWRMLYLASFLLTVQSSWLRIAQIESTRRQTQALPDACPAHRPSLTHSPMHTISATNNFNIKHSFCPSEISALYVCRFNRIVFGISFGVFGPAFALSANFQFNSIPFQLIHFSHSVHLIFILGTFSNENLL